LGIEWGVDDLVNDEQWVAAEPRELILEAAGSLRVAEAGDPFGRGREQHAVSGRAGTDPGRDREVSLAGARRAGDLRPFLSPPVAVRR
jgi:hypothetical protein